jgi:hypothetical protein
VSGRGLSFWFRPWSMTLAELPVDDRELALLFHGRSPISRTWWCRGVDLPDPWIRCARPSGWTSHRPAQGVWLRQPLEKIATLLSQLAQQHTQVYLQGASLRDILAQGHARVRETHRAGAGPVQPAGGDGAGGGVGAHLCLKPSNDLERALEAPTRERIQQESDEASFRRRALAVEKERAIQENELQNQIELARGGLLIEQRGQNARRDATEKAEAGRIENELRRRRCG